MAKVLLIEDDPLMSRMYMRVFQHEGLEFDYAEDGALGVEKAISGLPSLILLDVMMQKMDGFQALEKIKSDPKTKNIPVIMLTNLAGEADKDRAIKMGAIKYLVKSNYTPREVVQIVKETLGIKATPAG